VNLEELRDVGIVSYFRNKSNRAYINPLKRFEEYIQSIKYYKK
tara:strand:- start:153 stop:281 length:129 start_codon:yes stop_codon:yes gene_type:complete